MPKYAAIIESILRGTSDANIRFDDLCAVLRFLGFRERIKGSHHIFTKDGMFDRINLQSDAAKAKPYQVKQVRSIIVRYKLWSN